MVNKKRQYYRENFMNSIKVMGGLGNQIFQYALLLHMRY